MSMSELDPTTVRVVLERHRDVGSSFGVAWLEATGNVAKADDEETQGLRNFMERHFRAAYNDTPSSLGRCGMEAPEHGVSIVAVARPQTRVGKCRSGDGCDSDATSGRFGDHWCDRHGDQLARIAEDIEALTRAADLRVTRPRAVAA